jgi:hypothetical protein
MTLTTDLCAEYAAQDGDNSDGKPVKMTRDEIAGMTAEVDAEIRHAAAIERAIDMDANFPSIEEAAAEMDRKMGW